MGAKVIFSMGGWNQGCHGIKHRAWPLRNHGPPMRVCTIPDLEKNLKSKTLSIGEGRGWNGTGERREEEQLLFRSQVRFQLSLLNP